ncbi:MAG: TRAP transporter large permease [Burkholderiaceae bacterium]
MASAGLVVLVVVMLALRQSVPLLLLSVAGYAMLVWGDGELTYLIEDIWYGTTTDLLLAIPMFLLAGNIMTRGSIAQRLIDVVRVGTQWIHGGMAIATILSCALFAAISGSSPVTMLAVGTVMMPALLEAGYPRRFALGAITSAGTLGIIIPPSIPLILYGIVNEKSIVDLFVAGLVPGLLLAGALAAYSYVRNRHMPAEPFDRAAFVRALRRGVWSMLLPVILLGGIYSGYFSPTEAAAVSVLYALLVEIFIHRELKPAQFIGLTVDTARMLGTLMPIVAVALSLQKLLTINQVQQDLAAWVTGLVDSKVAFLLVVNLLLLVLGCLVDVISAVLVVSPLLLAPAMAYGIDPIHFGIMMVINLEIGFLTPPVGLNLIVAMSAFKAGFAEVVRAVLPFIALMLAVLMLVTYVPELSLWLVN